MPPCILLPHYLFYSSLLSFSKEDFLNFLCMLLHTEAHTHGMTYIQGGHTHGGGIQTKGHTQEGDIHMEGHTHRETHTRRKLTHGRGIHPEEKWTLKKTQRKNTYGGDIHTKSHTYGKKQKGGWIIFYSEVDVFRELLS